MTRLVFLFDSTMTTWGTDLEAIRSTLARAEAAGVVCEVIDTARMRDETLDDWRERATVASVWRHQAVRQAFGSRRQSGLPYFGKQVPALLVYESGERVPVAIYPHAETRGDTRADFTIEEYLKGLLWSVGDSQ